MLLEAANNNVIIDVGDERLDLTRIRLDYKFWKTIQSPIKYRILNPNSLDHVIIVHLFRQSLCLKIVFVLRETLIQEIYFIPSLLQVIPINTELTIQMGDIVQKLATNPPGSFFANPVQNKHQKLYYNTVKVCWKSPLRNKSVNTEHQSYEYICNALYSL